MDPQESLQQSLKERRRKHPVANLPAPVLREKAHNYKLRACVRLVARAVERQFGQRVVTGLFLPSGDKCPGAPAMR